MKTLTCTLSFLLLTIFSMAQSPVLPYRHQVRIGVGALFLGSGDMIGSTYRNEYEYLIQKRVSVAASLNFGQAAREIQGLGTKTYRVVKSITTTDINLLFAPIDTKTFKIKIGAGLSLKKQLDNDPRSVGFSRTNYGGNPNFEMIDYSYQGNIRTFSVGWTVPVSIELYHNRFVYHLRPSLHSFSDGEINTALVFGVGYRF